MRFDEFIANLRYAFRPKKPGLVVRLAHAFLKAKLLRRPGLRYVDFAIDFRCNLSCKHCFATALNQPGRRTMSPGDYARVVRQAMNLGAVNFSFQGGEPLMAPSLDAVIKAARPQWNLISVTTNGTLLTTANLDRLAGLGVDILTVSLDSGIPEEHDRFRGLPGGFDRTMEGIRQALAKGFRVTIGTVVTHGNLHSPGIQKLLQLAEELRLILVLILPVPAGRWKTNPDIFLTEQDLDHIYDITRRSSWVRTDFQANLGPYGCGAVKEILYLTPYGDVLSCPFIHLSLGNIFEESVAAIRARALRHPAFREYHQRCLASTDQEFLETHLKKTFDAKRLPIPWNEGLGRDV